MTDNVLKAFHYFLSVPRIHRMHVKFDYDFTFSEYY